MTVNNISEHTAETWSYTPADTIWVTIQEPTDEYVENPYLQAIPYCQVSFWDVCQIKEYTNFLTGDPEYYYPPTYDDALKIVRFLLENPNKNVLVNCQAGISRSGAVAQFCVDVLKYEWAADGKNRAVPNSLLYSLMVKAYNHIIEGES